MQHQKRKYPNRRYYAKEPKPSYHNAQQCVHGNSKCFGTATRCRNVQRCNGTPLGRRCKQYRLRNNTTSKGLGWKIILSLCCRFISVGITLDQSTSAQFVLAFGSKSPSKCQLSACFVLKLRLRHSACNASLNHVAPCNGPCAGSICGRSPACLVMAHISRPTRNARQIGG